MNKRREWWLIEDKKILSSNRIHAVLDEEQVRNHQFSWDGPYSKKSDFIHVVELKPGEIVLSKEDLRNAYDEFIDVFKNHSGPKKGKWSDCDWIEHILFGGAPGE